MTKSELAQKISQALDTTKANGELALNTVTSVITSALKGGKKITLTGFGTFSVSRRKARTGVNPQNPSQKIQIPAMKVPKFKAGKALKDAVR
ncbi:MAG: HU family DNA-binding protein [Candidatus Jacksonbacteria bacterium]